MSTLLRGGRAKLKQANGIVDIAPLQSSPPTNGHGSMSMAQLPTDEDSSIPFPEPSNSKAADNIGSITRLRFKANLTGEVNQVASVGATGVDQDDGSSSLSEPEERPIAEDIETGNRRSSDSEEGDTEAETERLEESPQKRRKQKHVILSSSKAIAGKIAATAVAVGGAGRISKSALHVDPSLEEISVPVSGDLDDAMNQISDISSFADSADDASRVLSPTTISRPKRKRSSTTPELDQDPSTKPAKKMAIHHVNSIIDQQGTNGEEPALEGVNVVHDLVLKDSQAAERFLHPATYSMRRGRRSNKTEFAEKKLEDVFPNASLAVGSADPPESEAVDAAESIEEEADMDDARQSAEADVAARSDEEVIVKRAALDSLSAIERQFATLRDKLFEERLVSLNEEIEVLKHPNPAHPDYLTPMECINRRRDAKIEHAKIQLRYKVDALQRKAVGDRALHHSQYMQRVRDIRDDILKRANKEWYQLQRERRNCEDDEQNSMHMFSPHRPHQISQQLAYNTEVSILAGVAKHVGFPAAPSILGVKDDEADEDLRKMGIAAQRTPARVTSAMARLPRQQQAAEEQFLVQNPWAHPQPSIHHHIVNAAQRQMSQQSRTLSPLATPIVHRQPSDLTAPDGSASIIAYLQSAPSSSTGPTPMRVPQAPKASYHPDTNMVNTHDTPTKQHTNMVQSEHATPSTKIGHQDSNNPTSASPHQRGNLTRSPESTKWIPSPPVQQRTSIAKSVEPLPDTFSSPFRDSHRKDDITARKPYGVNLHTQFPRQVSVDAGAEHTGL